MDLPEGRVHQIDPFFPLATSWFGSVCFCLQPWRCSSQHPLPGTTSSARQPRLTERLGRGSRAAWFPAYRLGSSMVLHLFLNFIHHWSHLVLVQYDLVRQKPRASPGVHTDCGCQQPRRHPTEGRNSSGIGTGSLVHLRNTPVSGHTQNMCWHPEKTR